MIERYEMTIEDTHYVKGRGLLVIGKTEVKPFFGEAEIINVDGSRVFSQVTGIEYMGPWSPDRLTAFVLRGLDSVQIGARVRVTK